MNHLLELAISFGKIGLISLGGGNAMLKIIEYETVYSRQWLSQEELAGMVGSTFLFPGLTGVKLSALIGYKIAGMLGLLVSVVCLNLPGLVLALLGYQWLSQHDSTITRKIMIAVQYGAIALLAAACFSFAQGVGATYYSWSMVLACLLFFLALIGLNLSPFWGFLVFIGLCVFLIS